MEYSAADISIPTISFEFQVIAWRASVAQSCNANKAIFFKQMLFYSVTHKCCSKSNFKLSQRLRLIHPKIYTRMYSFQKIHLHFKLSFVVDRCCTEYQHETRQEKIKNLKFVWAQIFFASLIMKTFSMPQARKMKAHEVLFLEYLNNNLFLLSR